MKNALSISAGLLLTLSLLAGTALADGTTNCQPQYGGGQNCTTSSIVINKRVMIPGSDSQGGNGNFVDNLGVNDSKYTPGQTIKFDLTVTNNGSSELSNVTIKDIFPSYITFVPGAGQGSYDSNSKTLTYQVGNLDANQSKDIILIATADQVQGVVCPTNLATVTTDNGLTDSDTSQFCIQNTQIVQQQTKGGLRVFPPPQVTTTPSTGPEDLTLLGLIPAALAGLKLRKKATK